MNWGDVLKAAAGATAGAVVAWAATSLTLVGRVEAIEKGQQRVEALVVKLIETKGKP